MVLIASVYLIYINSQYTSLQQIVDKKILSVEFQNMPEIVLPLKEETVGYQYELLKSFLHSMGIKNIVSGSINSDIEIFYTSQVCKKCVLVNKEDLLLIGNGFDGRSNNIEFSDLYEGLILHENITQKYNISYSNKSLDDVVNHLSKNLISYSILTRSSYLFYKKYYPNLNIVKKIDTINLIWRFPYDDGTILESVFDFLESDKGNKITQRLNNKYYSRDTMSSYIFIGSRIFISDIVSKLPELEDIFKMKAIKYDIDWKLLAAISYQESKWSNDSISPTGVKGLMMLTESTAKMLNVDRLNINESIDGGARYITYLINKYREYKNETNIHLALAAYNVGPGHIDDVIKLTKKDSANINEWQNLKKYLLKLHKKEFYKTMKYGYARGWEAVQYVENVKQYYDILSFLEDKDKETENNIIYEVPRTL